MVYVLIVQKIIFTSSDYLHMLKQHFKLVMVSSLSYISSSVCAIILNYVGGVNNN